jgi:TatD DNase family protein
VTHKHTTWIDAHCHLADPRYSFTALNDIIARSKKAQISSWIQGGVSPLDWDRQQVIQNRYGSNVIMAFGLHPWWVSQCNNSSLEDGFCLLERRALQAPAIGELGLDFSTNFNSKEALDRQKVAFNFQLKLAQTLGKPLIIHAVRSHDHVISELQKKAPFKTGGIVHSFNGSLDVAKEYLALGFLISIGGSITKLGYKSLKKAVSCIPPDKIVIETDSPDQIPRLPGLPTNVLNEPANLIGIAKYLSDLCGLNYFDLLNSSTNNLKHLFRINV